MPRRPISQIEPRGLSREEAAAYVGLGARSFDEARKAGHYPAPTLPCGRYDRILLDRAMDKLSGVAVVPPAAGPADQQAAMSDYQKWKEKRGGPRAA